MDAVTGIPDLIGWLGLYLIADDIEDLGEFDRLHHWQAGAGLFLASLLLPPPSISGNDLVEP